MNYAKIRTTDTANGPGVRVSIWVTGCGFHCTGCFNEEAWNPSAGKEYTEDVFNYIIEALKPDYISGLSILGGEPLFPTNLDTVAELARRVKEIYGDKKTIWMWSGHVWEQILTLNEEKGFLQSIDVIIDGLFEFDKKDLRLKYSGSTNQRVIDVQKTMETNIITQIDNI